MHTEPFTLPGDMNDGLSELRDALASYVRESDELTLNGESVTRVSTAGLQLLLGAIRAAEHRGISARWESASPTLCDCAERLGLGAALKLPG